MEEPLKELVILVKVLHNIMNKLKIYHLVTAGLIFAALGIHFLTKSHWSLLPFVVLAIPLYYLIYKEHKKNGSVKKFIKDKIGAFLVSVVLIVIIMFI